VKLGGRSGNKSESVLLYLWRNLTLSTSHRIDTFFKPKSTNTIL